MNINPSYMAFLEWLIILGQWGIILYSTKIVIRHLKPNKILDGEIPVLTRIIPNYLAILLAICIIYISFAYQDSIFSIFKEFNQVKRNPVDSFASGVLATILLIVLDRSRNAVIIMFSIFFAVLILLPGISLDWTSEIVLIGTLGKMFSLSIGLVIYSEYTRRKNCAVVVENSDYNY